MTRYRVLISLTALVATSASASPYAAPVYPPTGSNVEVDRARHPPTQAEKALNARYAEKSKALQAEMAALKQANGGKLTKDDKALLRQKAETLVAAYNCERGRLDGNTLTPIGTPLC
jgi:hypothetical protein